MSTKDALRKENTRVYVDLTWKTWAGKEQRKRVTVVLPGVAGIKAARKKLQEAVAGINGSLLPVGSIRLGEVKVPLPQFFNKLSRLSATLTPATKKTYGKT